MKSEPHESLTLRALEPSDTDLLYLWENDPEMWQFGASPAPLSRHQIWEYISQYDSNPLNRGELRLMMQTPAHTVGAIDLYNIDMRNRHAYIGIMTARPHRRQGHATAALRIIGDYCRQNIGLHRLAATVATDNSASLALFEKGGFKITATLPKWIRRPDGTYTDAHILIKEL